MKKPKSKAPAKPKSKKGKKALPPGFKPFKKGGGK